MLTEQESQLQTYLEGFLTQRRKERMAAALAMRTRYMTCVLEDLYDPRNGSAVIRHCDALGIQDVHAIENNHRFRSDEQVDMGSGSWLDIHIHRHPENAPLSKKARRRAEFQGETLLPKRESQTPQVLENLKSQGYRIIVTSPHAEDDATPETLDLEAGPVAVLFGTEKYGASEEAKAAADGFLRIPMVGFVESFNISASAAIVLYTLATRMRASKLPWALKEEDAERTYFEWVKSATPHAKELIHHFYSDEH